MRIGDEVVIMSAPGRFRITALEGEEVNLENEEGVRKTVLRRNVRVLLSDKEKANV